MRTTAKYLPAIDQIIAINYYSAMSPRQFWESADSDNKKLCKRAGTSLANFKQIALFGGRVGANLALRLSKASASCGGHMSLDDIINPADKKMIAARKHREACRARAQARRERSSAA